MDLGYGASTLHLTGSDNWLTRYDQALEQSGLTPTSRAVITDDAKHIALASLHDSEIDAVAGTRVRTGVVMGAVQSGKTASMFGVAAHALDLGTNVLVVLAGTRTTLWRQTLERVQAQLDVGSERVKRRVLLPALDALGVDQARPSPRDLYRLTAPQVRRALSKRRPIILIVMKQVDHLAHAGKALHEIVYPEAAGLGLPVRLLVVDDEADDSSVSGDLSASTAQTLNQMKQVPRLILDLWEDRQRPGQTAADHLFATYIGYTATPQANFLQDPQNPLAPRDFVASLRTPGEHGALSPRSLTYRDIVGMRGWYTGSDIFYTKLADQLLVVRPEAASECVGEGEDEATDAIDVVELADAIRSYLVAAAIRMLRSPAMIGPMSARDHTFANAVDAAATVASPTSMLIHPSSAKQDHFAVAEAVRGWWNGGGSLQASTGVLHDLQTNLGAWRRWISSYADSAQAIFDRIGRPNGDELSSQPSWKAIAHAIEHEIIPATRIAVVNSDPDADDRPRFSPVPDGEGWQAAPDLSSIFISGNVMARGLTLEGLLTTLFTRETAAPLADTQMQMQRWFGYRGSYIDLCRVFLSERQRELFTAYADADHALRNQVLSAMDESDQLPEIAVLQGDSFQATGKISGLRALPLSPGRRPFIRFLNPPDHDDVNQAAVRDRFLDAAERQDLEIDRRGLLDRRSISLDEAADLFDSLRYVDHGSSPNERSRWLAYAELARIEPHDDRHPLYRAPEVPGATVDFGPSSPYTIAAYLRFWAAALERRVPGLFTDEQPAQRWSLLDLRAKSAHQPRFRIGLRFGSGADVTEGPLAPLQDVTGAPLRSMAREVQDRHLVATWGSRGATETGYSGDDLFDYDLGLGSPNLHPDGSRRAGSDGLILFHLIQREGGRGAIAVGLSMPAGGPDFVHAMTPHVNK